MQWNALPWLGTLHWCMCDCGEPGDAASASLWEPVSDKIKPRWPGNDYYGCMGMLRLPKESFYLFQSQWTEKPMIHITGHWTWPSETGKPRQVRVYSNCDTVELFLNGRSLGSREPGRCRQQQVWGDFRKTAGNTTVSKTRFLNSQSIGFQDRSCSIRPSSGTMSRINREP